MKKTSFLCLLVALLCLVSFAGAEGAPTDVDLQTVYQAMSIDELKETQEALQTILNEKIIGSATLQLSENECALAMGKTLKLVVSCDGREITGKTVVTYASSDEGVATVSKDTVRAAGAGSAVITASAAFEDGGVLTAQCTVTVFVPVKSVALSSRTLSVLVGQKAELSALASVTPEDATNQALTYAVSDEAIATVDGQGVLSALKAGEVTVTVTSDEATDKPQSATMKVSCLQPVEQITLDTTAFDVGKGGSHAVTCTISPSDASTQKVTWTSADTAIAKVSTAGVVTGVGTGSTVITCTANDGSGVAASADVTVITAVKKVSFDQKSMAITEGKSVSVFARVTPADATNGVLKWKSSNTSVASVDSSGRITTASTGNCTITASATDGSGAAATMTLYVEPKLPLYVSSIHWQTTWGMKNGKMGVEAESMCGSRTIKAFDYTVKCYSYYSSTPTIEYMTYSSPSIGPGKTGKSKLSKYAVGGFTNAYQVEITPTKVYYSDGTSEVIPEEDQYTSTFSM